MEVSLMSFPLPLQTKGLECGRMPADILQMKEIRCSEWDPDHWSKIVYTLGARYDFFRWALIQIKAENISNHTSVQGFRDSVFVPDRQCNHFKSSGQYFSLMQRLKGRMHLFRNEFNIKRTKSCSQKRLPLSAISL